MLIYLAHCLVFSKHGVFESEGLNARSRSGSRGWTAVPRVEMAERAAAQCWNWLLGYHGDPPSLGRQGKKCFHMPYNLQTATTETSSAFFYPSPLGIQTQLFSEITTSMSLEMWPFLRARKLVLYILRQSLELFSLRACQYSHSKPPLQGTQLDCASKHPNRVLATCSHTLL